VRSTSGWRKVRSCGAWLHLREISASHGERDLLRRSPAVRQWATEQWPLVIGALSTHARPISGMWFDKLPEANWRVPWHQDVHVPVAPFTADGWGPWSTRQELTQVIAPEPWLSRRIALRLHLDPCGESDGPLQVIPGSHRHGRLSPEQSDALLASTEAVTIHAEPGEVLIMHPLLLHRSAPARLPTHRRVIHIEWCDAPLPPGAVWLDGSHE
jgi:hypothetical protein